MTRRPGDPNDRQREESDSETTNHSLLMRMLIAFSLPLIVQDVPLPWKDWLISNLTESERRLLGRERLSYQIRTSDYQLRYGPAWLKRAAQAALERWVRYRFWVLVGVKVVISSLCVALPLFLFGIYKFYLPDPERYQNARTRSSDAQSSRDPETARVHLFPYELVDPDPAAMARLIDDWTKIDPFGLVFIAPLPSVAAAPSPALVKISTAPGSKAPAAARPAYLLNETSSLVFATRKTEGSERNEGSQPPNRESSLRMLPSAEILGGNAIGGDFVIFSNQKRRLRCRFELRDEHQNLLFSVEKFSISAAKRSGIESTFTLRPGETLATAENLWQSFRFRTDVLPQRLSFTVREAVNQDERSSVGGSSAALSAGEGAGGAALLDGSGCSVAVSEPQYQKLTLTSRSIQGIVLVVVDGLSGVRWMRPGVMPHLTALSARGHSYDHYFSPSADPRAAIQSILEPQDSHGLSAGSSIFERARRLGYQTAFFGDASDLYFDREISMSRQALPDEIIGESSDRYGGLSAALQASDWIGRNGATPYFVVVRLADLQGRLLPPWKFFDGFGFFGAPFGIDGRQRRYDAMLSYMDENLSFVSQRLSVEAQRSGRSSLLLVTGSTGIQSSEVVHRSGNSAGGLTTGATFSIGRSLLPDALHVPLVQAEFRPQANAESVLSNEHERSAFASHFELKDLLEQVLLSDEVRTLAARKQPLVITERQGIGLLGETQDHRISFWASGEIVSLGRFFRRSFPFEVSHEWLATGSGVSLTYDPQQGTLLQRPRHGLSLEDFNREDFFKHAFQDRDPSLILSSRLPSSWSRFGLSVKGAQGQDSASAQAPASSQGVRTLLSPTWYRSADAHLKALGESTLGPDGKREDVLVAEALEAKDRVGLFVAKGAFRKGEVMTIQAQGLSVCGRWFPADPFRLTRQELQEFERNPPPCLLVPGLEMLDGADAPRRVLRDQRRTSETDVSLDEAVTLGFGWP